jgi:hypothetical protein
MHVDIASAVLGFVGGLIVAGVVAAAIIFRAVDRADVGS